MNDVNPNQQPTSENPPAKPTPTIPQTDHPDEPIENRDELETMVKQKRNTTPATTDETHVTQSDTVSIPRATFNYVVIALVFFGLGALLGSFVFPVGGATQATLPDNFEVVVREAVNDAIESAGLIEDPGLVMGENYQLDIDISDNPYLGNPDAAVTVIEFSDFTCGFCGRFAENTLDPLIEEYGDQVRFVYMDYPFLSQMSVPAALAAECAHDQDEFWAMHDAIFANQQGLSVESMRGMAAEIGLDMETFNTCFDEGEHIEKIRSDLDIGRELGVSGTPAFFINGRFVSGAQPIEVFQQFIDEELATVQSS